MFVGRGKNKIRPDFGIQDIYKYYKENAKNPIEYKQFRTIWKELAGKIIHLIIYRNLDFAIPARMGTLSVRKMKTTFNIKEDGKLDKSQLCINYKASWDKWIKDYPNLTKEEIAKLPNKKYVYYLNEHTNGYKVRWRWDKFTCNVKNQNLYSLTMSRENKKELSKAFKEYKTDYYEYSRR